MEMRLTIIPPISAGLRWVTKPLTGFLNASLIQKSIQEGTTEKLVGFKIDERGIPRSGYILFDSDQNPHWKVTSEHIPLTQQGYRSLRQYCFFKTRA